MKEVKFRAWDKVYEHFHEGDIVRDYNLGDFIDNPEYAVTQYTGLKDRTGKELFFGDKYVFWVGPVRNTDVEIAEDLESIYNIMHNQFESGVTFEIVGNIYE